MPAAESASSRLLSETYTNLRLICLPQEQGQIGRFARYVLEVGNGKDPASRLW